jgi:[FeFe] hydrogenase H-cluster maturation GTPase HydF
MRGASKGFRIHIGIFGRRNVGKSSLVNAITRQNVSIVSETPGTTTDPVEKPMELLPLGPVLFIDTAGLDDAGTLGRMRVERSRAVYDRTDIGVLVAEAGQWGEDEEAVLRDLGLLKVPVVVAFNKADIRAPDESLLARLSARNIQTVRTAAPLGTGMAELREALVRAAPEECLREPPILSDLVPPGQLAILVVPIDKEAPKGRIILPQVQAIRDALDHDAMTLVVKETGLRAALDRLNAPPALVVTDSQAFMKVAQETPESVPMTSFSILFARLKGDLAEMARGALAIDRLRPGDRVLVAEACAHHPVIDDIGRVKMPKWLRQRAGDGMEFTTVQGHDFPQDLSPFRLVIHCGACMWNRREMLTRILRCREASVPITNYGLAIALCMGVFERALAPFPDVYSEAALSR